MERYDAKKAAGVWERVTAGAEQQALAVEPMLVQLWENAVAFLHLSKRLQGVRGAQLHKLYQQSQQSADCLKGICMLVNGSRPALGNKLPSQETVEATLRACYGRAMRLMAQMESVSGHKEYGPVFARLAALQQEQCRQVLEILGSLEQKPKNRTRQMG